MWEESQCGNRVHRKSEKRMATQGDEKNLGKVKDDEVCTPGMGRGTAGGTELVVGAGERGM
jgi:hypothetical protein